MMIIIEKIICAHGGAGQWNAIAALEAEIREFNGLKIPTRRRVIPMIFGNRPLPGPTLVEIDVHEMSPIWVSSD